MKILVIVKWLVRWNGASRSAYELSKHFKKEHEVRIVAYKDYIDPEWEKGFYIHKLKHKGPLALREVRKVIKEYQPDVIYSQNHLGLGAIFTDIPLVVVNRSNWPMNWFFSIRNFVAGIFLEIPQEIETHFANKVVSVSKYTQKGLRKRGISSVVIYNGLDKSYFKHPKEYVNLKHPAILFVGAVDNRKAKYLVQFVRLLNKKTDNVHTYVIGPSINKDIVEELRNLNNTYYLGIINDVKPYYYEADLLIFTSRVEACPRVLIEAQACGLPAIAFDVCSHSEIVKNEETGFLVKIGNSNAMVEKTLKLLEDDHLRKKMSEKAVGIAKENFLLDDKAEQYLKLFKSVIYDENR